MLVSEIHSWSGARMATLSPSELLDWLGQFQFLSALQTDALRPLLSTFPDSLAFAKELLRRDWLTPYQVNQVMQGKHDQLVLGIYRLRERIGEGAMGQVFKAWNVRLERIVAVKTIHKELINSTKAMDRFRREVETVSQLDHPNIALVRDADEIAGRPFLVMDFIEGLDLSRRVKQNGPLPIHEAVEYARQTALGLQHAFERGIVHRDIKPANLMVTTMRYNDDTLEVVKILDFGLARFESEQDSGARLTQVGKLLGTIDYIAPEQAQDARNADIRADIYSLGCSLYFLLSGKPPFEGKDMLEKLGPRVTGDPPWVRALRPEVPPLLEEVLRKMMARRPDDRYQTPIEAAQALEPFATASKSVGVAMALPVASGAIAPGTVAMAMPVYSPAAAMTLELPPIAKVAPPASEEGPAFLGMTATGRDMSSGATASVPHAAKPGKPFPIKLVLLLGGAAALVTILVCLGSCLYNWGAAKKTEGVVRIDKAIYSIHPIEPGERKRILVYISREKFKGPVKLTLHGLPPGVTSEPFIMPESISEGDIAFTVSYGTDPTRTTIRVKAECEAEGISAEKEMPFEIVQKRLKKGTK